MTKIMNDNDSTNPEMQGKLVAVLRQYGAELAEFVDANKVPANMPRITVTWRKGEATLFGDRVGDNTSGLADFGQVQWVVLNTTDFDDAEAQLRQIEIAEAKVVGVRMERTSGCGRVAAIEEAEAGAHELRAQFGQNYGKRGGANSSQRELWWRILDGDIKPHLGRDGVYTVWWKGDGYIVGSDYLEMFAKSEEVSQWRREVYQFAQGWYPLINMPAHFPKWEPAV